MEKDNDGLTFNSTVPPSHKLDHPLDAAMKGKALLNEAPQKMDLATGCYHPAMEVGWGHKPCAGYPRTGHSWDPAREQPGLYRGSDCCSWWFCQTGRKVDPRAAHTSA